MLETLLLPSLQILARSQWRRLSKPQDPDASVLNGPPLIKQNTQCLSRICDTRYLLDDSFVTFESST